MRIKVENCAAAASGEFIHNVAHYCRRDEAQILRGDIYISRPYAAAAAAAPVRPTRAATGCSPSRPYAKCFNLFRCNFAPSFMLVKFYFVICKYVIIIACEIHRVVTQDYKRVK